MDKFTIIGRQRNGTTIDGYILRDNETGEVRPYPKRTVYEYAFRKLISDVIVQEYKGKITMKGTKYKISELPCYDEFGNRINKQDTNENLKPKVILNGKCTDGKNIVAYRVAMVIGGVVTNQKLISRAKVMELAKSGAISNARYQQSNGVGILRGVDCKLANLPNVELV